MGKGRIDIEDGLLAPKGLWFWLVTIALGLVSAAIYLANVPNREAIDAALKKKFGGGRNIGLFALCLRDASCSWGDYDLVPPERLFCYDRSYLEAFIARAGSEKTSFGDTALARYITPTLTRDVAFATVFSLFIAFSAIGVAHYLPWGSSHLMVFCAVMGLIYRIVDVLEDRRLAHLLQNPAQLDDKQAAAVNRLTQAKLATINLSIIGMLVFLFFGFVRSVVKRFGG